MIRAKSVSAPRRATRIALLSIAALAVAPALIAAKAVVSGYSSSRPQNEAYGQPDLLVFAWTVAMPAAVIAAPMALVLSVVAMIFRARCLEPKPKLPVIALGFSVGLVGMVAWVLIFFWSLGQMH